MPKTVVLDVRPHLRKKLEPFQLIMDTVKQLDKDELFELHATFKPTPLLALMRTKGYKHKLVKKEADHWIVTFVHKSNRHLLDRDSDAANGEPEEGLADADTEPAAVAPEENPAPQVYRLDNRGLEPPQPMVRTLSRLEKASAGDQVIIHNDRVPMFLIEELRTLGYAFDIEEQDDGSAIVTITKS